MSALLLLLVPALHAESGGADSTGRLRHHVAQARQFVRHGWYADAAAELEAALALPEGGESFDAHWLSAQVHYELVDIERAADLADRAARLAPNAEAREQAADFAGFLRASFGAVTVRAPADGMRSPLRIERADVLFDVDQKRLLGVVADRARKGLSLPARLSLPAGDYRINGAAVTVPAGGATEVRLDAAQLEAGRLAALQVARVELGAGTSVLFGGAAASLRPGLATELGVTAPVGALRLGAVGTWELRSHLVDAHTYVTDPASWSAGFSIGREAEVDPALVVGASIGARYARIPGIGLGCTPSGAVLACAPGVAGESAASADASAVVPFGSLAAELRPVDGAGAVGGGLKLVVEAPIGWVPAEGRTDPAAVAPDVPWNAEPRGWTALGVRLLATLRLAF